VDETPANKRSGEPRKPYAKPQIEEVALRPEEAVLGACKTPSVSGPAQAKCSFPTGCSALTS
jgi:hypothetical protein